MTDFNLTAADGVAIQAWVDAAIRQVCGDALHPGVTDPIAVNDRLNAEAIEVCQEHLCHRQSRRHVPRILTLVSELFALVVNLTRFGAGVMQPQQAPAVLFAEMLKALEANRDADPLERGRRLAGG